MPKPIKDLGQYFLNSDYFCEIIADYFDIANKSVVEIGPGTGELTKKIIKKKPKKFLVIEKDKRFIPIIRSISKTIMIINNDILKVDVSLIDNYFKNEKYYAFGNLPYNISSQILFLFCNYFNCKKMIFMFQKEFGNKILLKKNFYSHYINNFWNLQKICIVEKKFFRPIPKVDGILIFFSRNKSYDKVFYDNSFVNFMKKSFTHSRKTFINNHPDIKDKLIVILKENNFRTNIRTDEIEIKDLIKIYNNINKND